MNNQKEIEKLLLLFYKGNTTSEDEIYLYRLLIDQLQEQITLQSS